MELVIIGDEDKARDNFTRVMFDITLQRWKDGDYFEKRKDTNAVQEPRAKRRTA